MKINVGESSAEEVLDYYLHQIEEEAGSAHKEGRLVCWSAALAPAEFCEAMDVSVVYPEIHAAVFASGKGNTGLLEAAARKGYGRGLCSCARNSIGFMEMLKQRTAFGSAPEALQESGAARVSLPDFVFVCNNICDAVLKWYEALARELAIPCIILDVPYNHTMPVSRHNKEYLAAQFLDVVKKLERICKKPFDYEKFYQAQVQTQRTVYQWKRVAALAFRKPSPLNGFDLFKYMEIVVMCRPKMAGEIVLRKFADELEADAAGGRFAYGEAGEEKYRVTWEGNAVWPFFNLTGRTFKETGSLLAGAGVPGMWNITYIPGDLASMAEAYSSIYLNCGAPYRYEELCRIVESSQSEGIVFHIDHSCKIASFLHREGAEYVQDRNGVPFTYFDGDQADPEVFTGAQFENRLRELTEKMEIRKS